MKLKVWHIPQVPGVSFDVPVDSVEEAVKIMSLLADYDTFQFENHIKPDYCNAQGLLMWDEEQKEWTDWYDEESGIGDPEEYLSKKEANRPIINLESGRRLISRT